MRSDNYRGDATFAVRIEANNIKVKELAGEEGAKVAQNVAAGVAGIVIPVLWFGMDFKGAASKEVTALQARQQYLTTLATERCKPGAAPPQGPALMRRHGKALSRYTDRKRPYAAALTPKKPQG